MIFQPRSQGSSYFGTSHLKPPHPPPPNRALAGDFGELSPHIHFILVPHAVGREFTWSHGLRIPYQVNLSRSIIEITSTIKIFWHTYCALTSFSKLFAGRTQRSICLFHARQQCLLTSVHVMLGNNKLFYKGSTMCWTVGAGECTTHFCSREPRTSPTFTCIKSECPAQTRMGDAGVSNDWGFTF